MTIDFATFVVALYTIVDDLYKTKIAPLKTEFRGRPPEVSDSEILTLMLLAQWKHLMDRKLLRCARKEWRPYFPRLLDQSAYNRRSRHLAGVLMQLIPEVAIQLGAHTAAYQVFDCLPLPLLRRCRGVRHRIFADEAGFGRGGSDREWYYGVQVLVPVTPEGVITGFVMGSAATEERWLAEALLCWRANPEGQMLEPEDLPPSHKRGGIRIGPTGPIGHPDSVGEWSLVPYVVDDGFDGKLWLEHWCQDYGAMVFTGPMYQGETAPTVRREHHGWRQIIEAVNGQLEQNLGFAFPGARSLWGLLTRVAAKLLACNLGIWLNRSLGCADLAFATLFNC